MKEQPCQYAKLLFHMIIDTNLFLSFTSNNRWFI